MTRATRTRTALRLVALLGLAWPLAGAASPEPSTVRRGLVVDAESSAPVAGANVSAGGAATATDEGGRFALRVAPTDSITVTHVGYQPATIAPGEAFAQVLLRPALLRLGDVVVRAGLTPEAFSQAASSVTVVGGPEVRATGRSHLQDLTASIPNLTWAGGTSRPRYFQIRGVGESSRYAGEGPPTFSVGFAIDDVDLSGLGSAGLLFDIDQVEVFRGPQSTVFGSNAMAGAIDLRSTEPTGSFALKVSSKLGGDGLKGVEGFIDLPLRADLAVRLGGAADRSNGFRDNLFLGRDDTNRRRESALRAKVRWGRDGGARVTATAFRVDLDNGYDAWAPDNNRDLVTHSDQPGVDRQETWAASLRAEVPLAGLGGRLVSITGFHDTDVEYSYDGDWGNDGFWRQPPYDFDPVAEGWRYAFFDRLERARRTFTQEARWVHDRMPLLGGQGVAGAHFKRLAEDDDATGYLFGGEATDLASAFDIDELALYGQYSRALTERLRLTANARADRNATEYAGRTNLGGEGVAFDVADWLAGGRLSLAWAPGSGSTVFGAASRGYRPGGVNQHPRLAAANRPYRPEHLLGLEAGYRFGGDRARTGLTLFYGRRSTQQVELSSQQDAGDPNSFVYFTSNAGSGWNAGVEVEQRYALTPALALFGSAGYLRSRVEAYTFATAQGEELTLGDRAPAHAPPYNLRLGAEWQPRRGLSAGGELTAVDGFFYSDSHDRRSRPYQLVNGSAGYAGAGWSVRVWGRNLLDERYGVRGFYFGLEPPAYPDRLYVSYGDPRQVGVTLTTDLFEGGRHGR